MKNTDERKKPEILRYKVTEISKSKIELSPELMNDIFHFVEKSYDL